MNAEKRGKVFSRAQLSHFEGRDLSGLSVEIGQTFDQDNHLSDFTLKIKSSGEEYRLHKIILSSLSGFFRGLFANEWAETKKGVCELDVEPECLEVFPQFLQFFYTGKAEMDIRTFWLFFILADKYIVQTLATVCHDFVTRSLLVNVDRSSIRKEMKNNCYINNIADTYEVTVSFRVDEIVDIFEIFEDDGVRRACAGNLMARLHDVEDDAWWKFDCQLVRMMLEQNISSVHEFLLLTKIVGWLSADTSRSPHAVQYLKFIRYGDMEQKDVYQCLELPLIMRSQELLDHVCCCAFYTKFMGVLRERSRFPVFSEKRFRKRVRLARDDE